MIFVCLKSSYYSNLNTYVLTVSDDILSFQSLQKLHREALLPQQQVSHLQHCSPPDSTTLQHQVGLSLFMYWQIWITFCACSKKRWLSTN